MERLSGIYLVYNIAQRPSTGPGSSQREQHLPRTHAPPDAEQPSPRRYHGWISPSLAPGGAVSLCRSPPPFPPPPPPPCEHALARLLLGDRFYRGGPTLPPGAVDGESPMGVRPRGSAGTSAFRCHGSCRTLPGERCQGSAGGRAPRLDPPRPPGEFCTART